MKCICLNRTILMGLSLFFVKVSSCHWSSSVTTTMIVNITLELRQLGLVCQKSCKTDGGKPKFMSFLLVNYMIMMIVANNNDCSRIFSGCEDIKENILRVGRCRNVLASESSLHLAENGLSRLISNASVRAA